MAKSKKPESPEASLSKMDAVKAAISSGVDKPLAASAYITEKFGLSVTPQMFSTYKNSLNKKKTKVKKTEKARIGVGNITSNGSIGVALARDVKKLVEQYGAPAVKEMADVFAG